MGGGVYEDKTHLILSLDSMGLGVLKTVISEALAKVGWIPDNYIRE